LTSFRVSSAAGTLLWKKYLPVRSAFARNMDADAVCGRTNATAPSSLFDVALNGAKWMLGMERRRSAAAAAVTGRVCCAVLFPGAPAPPTS